MCAVTPSSTTTTPTSFLSAPFLSAVIPFPPEDSHPHLPPIALPHPHPLYPFLAPHAGANFRASSRDSSSIQLELSLHPCQARGASLVLRRVLQLSSRACRRCAEREVRMGHLRKRGGCAEASAVSPCQGAMVTIKSPSLVGTFLILFLCFCFLFSACRTLWKSGVL